MNIYNLSSLLKSLYVALLMVYLEDLEFQEAQEDLEVLVGRAGHPPKKALIV